MTPTKDEAIARLRQALHDILQPRSVSATNYPDVIYEVKEIARTALDDTRVIAQEEHHPENLLVDYINRCEDLVSSRASWEFKYDRVFDIFAKKIRPLIQELSISFDYYDPDTSYEEDVVALMGALRDLKDNLKGEYYDGDD